MPIAGEGFPRDCYRVARMPAHGPVVGGLSEYRGKDRPSMISIDLKITEPLTPRKLVQVRTLLT